MGRRGGQIRIVARKRLSAELGTLARGMPRLRLAILDRIKEDWFKFVESSTWEDPRPAPRSDILATIRGRGYFQLELGWVDYGAAQASAARLREREDLFVLRVPEHIDTILKRLRG